MVTDVLRRSFITISQEDDLDRLPYGTLIASNVVGCSELGVVILMKIAQGEWRTVEIYGNPKSCYEIEELDKFEPKLPALLVMCGDELPPQPRPSLKTKRHLSLIWG